MTSVSHVLSHGMLETRPILNEATGLAGHVPAQAHPWLRHCLGADWFHGTGICHHNYDELRWTGITSTPPPYPGLPPRLYFAAVEKSLFSVPYFSPQLRDKVWAGGLGARSAETTLVSDNTPLSSLLANTATSSHMSTLIPELCLKSAGLNCVLQLAGQSANCSCMPTGNTFAIMHSCGITH